mgnify:CR=1 FL=1
MDRLQGCAYLVPGLCSWALVVLLSSFALVSLTLLCSASIYFLHYIKFYTVCFSLIGDKAAMAHCKTRPTTILSITVDAECTSAIGAANGTGNGTNSLPRPATTCHDLPRPCPFTTHSLLLYIYRVVHLRLIQFTVTVHDLCIIYYRQKAVCDLLHDTSNI